MSRFSDEPIKNPLSGNEVIPATDPSSTDDVGMTPEIITQFAQKNMTLGTGSTQGLISGPMADKLSALHTEAQFTNIINQLSESAIPAFFGTPANGFTSYYYHALTLPWLLNDGASYVSAGSTNFTLAKNGTPLAGAVNIPVTTTPVGFSFSDLAAARTLGPGDTLGITFAGTTGNCANLVLSLNATAQVTP